MTNASTLKIAVSITYLGANEIHYLFLCNLVFSILFNSNKLLKIIKIRNLTETGNYNM